MDVVGILLCGGAARRFGGDKLMAGDPPLAVRAARNLHAVTPRVLGVLPLGAGALRQALEREGVEILETDRTARGMGASLAAGVEAARRADGWIVALGDMPLVRPATIAALRDALQSGALLAAPFDERGRRGHPVAFSPRLADALVSLDGDLGARDVVARHAAQLRAVVTDDPGIFVDVDTPQDLAALGPATSG